MAESNIPVTSGAGNNVDVFTLTSPANLRQAVVIGDPSLNAGAATVDSVLGLSVNLKGANGIALDTNSGVKSAGTMRVVIATDQPTNSNPFFVSQQAAITGGWTPYTYVSTASTNANNLKASAGSIGSIQVFNNSGTIGYLKLFNKASSPTVGTDTPVKNILIPANNQGTGAVIPLGDSAVSFSLGISFAVTGGIALLDATATAANVFSINIDYK